MKAVDTGHRPVLATKGGRKKGGGGGGDRQRDCLIPNA